MLRSILASALFLVSVALPVSAQDAARLIATPASATLAVGESIPLTVQAAAADGALVDDAVVTVAAPRGALAYQNGTLSALQVGEFEVIATLSRGAGSDPLTLRIPVTVTWPEIDRIEVSPLDDDVRLYSGTQRFYRAIALHADGTERPDPDLNWTSSDPSVATVNALGHVRGVGTGTTTLTVRSGDAVSTTTLAVEALPEGALVLDERPHDGPVRTGDVLTFDALYRAGSSVLDDVPVVWTATRVAEPFEYAGAPAGAHVRDGKFVADIPGTYQVMATVGPHAVDKVFEVAPRDVVEEVEVTGHAPNAGYRLTDLWVFEGVDGRDYAMTGSKVADGHAYFYDVTDPGNIMKYDSIQVNGRTVNDVKVSPDGRYGVISREGASDRRNGIVIVDLADPRNPAIASIYDEGLTGGVHNIFATDDHLFALAAGDKYVILDVTDIYEPTFVSEYNHPDSRLHDVWVHDGIAYSSEWGNGVVVVDVGNGRWGGTIENPVFVTNYVLPTGRTHAAFPYYSESADKVYIFTGDEIMSRGGLAWAGYPRSMGSYSSRYDPDTGTGGIPLTTTGYIQIIDFTDPEDPEMVARYEVPEFGTHNMWIEDDRLYQAYYEGGVRVVDVSGELMGNLYDQGREIAVFKSADPAGYTPNATMVWGAQPHKGHVFFSDTNSGLWSIRLIPRDRPVM